MLSLIINENNRKAVCFPPFIAPRAAIVSHMYCASHDIILKLKL